MTWLVFGVSCLLVLAGAVSIICGAPIIQLERGWAEVISGTVALSSGGVVFALAGILMRLESIRDTMAARTLPVVTGSLLAAAVPSPAPESDKVPPEAAAAIAEPPPEIEPVTSSAPVPVDDGKTEGLWKRVKRPGPEGTAAERPDAESLRQHGFPDRVVPDEPLPAAPTETIPVVVPAHRVPADAPPALSPPRSDDPVAQDAAAAERDPGQIGWLERSLFKSRAARTSVDAVSSRPEPSLGAPPLARPTGRDGRVEPSLDTTGEPSAPRQPLFPASEPPAAAEPARTPDLASEHYGGATVVGRYQAGSASYVMYSDGTIEVETESGEVHRFGSMDELKAFIAQQDTTVS